MKRLLIASILIILSGYVSGQKRPLELFILADLSEQSYKENLRTGTSSHVEKVLYDHHLITYGIGAQTGFDLSRGLTLFAGGGLKYTSTLFGFINPVSSHSDWYFPAFEDMTQYHLFLPLKIYYRSRHERRFRVNPGFSLEPHLLLYHQGELTIWNEDIMSEVADPEGSPRKISILSSFNLKFSYGLNLSREIFAELSLHSPQRLYREEIGLSSPVALMLSLGFRF